MCFSCFFRPRQTQSREADGGNALDSQPTSTPMAQSERGSIAAFPATTSFTQEQIQRFVEAFRARMHSARNQSLAQITEELREGQQMIAGASQQAFDAMNSAAVAATRLPPLISREQVAQAIRMRGREAVTTDSGQPGLPFEDILNLIAFGSLLPKPPNPAAAAVVSESVTTKATEADDPLAGPNPVPGFTNPGTPSAANDVFAEEFV